MLLVIIYNNFFQPVHFYETSYKYQAADSTYMHDVAINVSIKGNHFTSDIIIRELVKSENKNYYNVIGHGDIIQKTHINITLTLIISMCIPELTKPT